jgi:hypothetical protein
VFSIKTDFEFNNILKRNLAEKYRRKRRIISEQVHVSDILHEITTPIADEQNYSRTINPEYVGSATT